MALWTALEIRYGKQLWTAALVSNFGEQLCGTSLDRSFGEQLWSAALANSLTALVNRFGEQLSHVAAMGFIDILIYIKWKQASISIRRNLKYMDNISNSLFPEKYPKIFHMKNRQIFFFWEENATKIKHIWKEIPKNKIWRKNRKIISNNEIKHIAISNCNFKQKTKSSIYKMKYSYLKNYLK